ncbi:MAG: hypothetical protein RR681_07810 [Lachnospiraceae bacterium]
MNTQENPGWNMITINIVLILLYTSFKIFQALPKSIHLAWRCIIAILCGIAVAFVFIVLNILPIVGILVQIGSCVLWSYIILSLLPLEKLFQHHPQILWGCRIGIVLFFILVHLGSFIIMFGDIKSTLVIPLKKHTYIKKSSYIEKQIHIEEPPRMNTTSTQSEFLNEEQLKDLMKEAFAKGYEDGHGRGFQSGFDTGFDNGATKTTQKPEKTNPDNPFDLFAGCTDIESLKSRYKYLSKSFHPDVHNGDEKNFKYLNAEYEKRLKQFSK